MRLLNEYTMFKVLVDKNGAMLSVTTKKRAYFFFLARGFVGGRVAPTTDPHPGIVEICGYDIPKIIQNWDRLYRLKLLDG